MTQKTGLLLLGFLATAALAIADPPTPKFYKLEIVVKELEGAKVTATRNYSMAAATHNSASLHSNSRVAFAEGGTAGTYDVFLNIDIRAMEEMEGGVAASFTIELMNPGNPVQPAQPGGVRANEKWSGAMLLQKKPSMVFTSQSADGRHIVQVEMAAVASN